MGQGQGKGCSWTGALPTAYFQLSHLAFLCLIYWSLLQYFLKKALSPGKVENCRPVGFIHLLSTYCVPDIALGTGNVTVKQMDKNPCPQEPVF